MEWTAEVSSGDWLKLRTTPAGWPGLRSFIPSGFEAYLRVFHPMTRDRVLGHEWAQIETDFGRGTFYEIETDVESATWAETAAAFGTTMHPLAQSHRILGREYGSNVLRVDAAGWRYTDPSVGRLPVEELASIVSALTAGSRATGHGIAAIWEGFGGLTSSTGYADVGLGLSDDDAAERPDDDAAVGTPNTISWSDSAPGTGLLSAEAASGPRLAAPNRDYILFRVGRAEFTDISWPHRAPWVRPSEISSPPTPTMLWPDDHSWFLISEIDFDSTIIGCSRTHAADLLTRTGIEALPITLDADLTTLGDRVNF
ncbi:hypothetical protein AB4Y63_04475 [Leifsonia sp. YAF41]|uniref:hypothetical protein n=1 Tax=Leifsonia sp. YAF41 TaxID=3233086 RepID=UPI003F9500AD